MLKLMDQMPRIYGAFKENESAIRLYARKLKAQGGYSNFETRLAGDCMRAFIGTETMCSWYGLYHVHDGHIINAAKTTLRKLGII